MEEWRNGVMEEWSIGVLECCTCGPSAFHYSSTPPLHHSTTPPLHHSRLLFVMNVARVSFGISYAFLYIYRQPGSNNIRVTGAITMGMNIVYHPSYIGIKLPVQTHCQVSQDTAADIIVVKMEI